MPRTFQLHNRKPITYDSASGHEDNIINKLANEAETTDLYEYLWEQKQTIEALVAHHLGLSGRHSCLVLDQRTWIRGGFNVCIPVEVKVGGTSKKVLMRCPIPGKLAVKRYPGTQDEKIGCEVGTYAWMQDNCPHIRIPHLFGFGFSNHRHFTHALHRPFYVRFARIARRAICTLLRYPVPSQYTHNQAQHRLRTGYLLLEYIEPRTGQMLSDTWDMHREDLSRKQNLFRSMARLIFSMARIPQPRIGSFQFHNDGTVTLTNRPLPRSTRILENYGAPRLIQKSDTYTCTEAFVADTLTFYDSNFLNQPNAAFDEPECHSQMTVMKLLRAVAHHFIQCEHRNGPYVLQFTDFHISNLFVDDE